MKTIEINAIQLNELTKEQIIQISGGTPIRDAGRWVGRFLGDVYLNCKAYYTDYSY